MSSDSKPNSRRSRKKESKRPERHDDLRPVDNSPPNEGKTNLFAMMLGMITSIVLIFGVFGFGSEEVVNEKYDRELDRRRQARIDADRAATLDELSIELAELGSARTNNLADTLQVCKSRIEVSDEILARGPSGEAMRQLAASEGMLARKKRFGLDFLHNLNLESAGSDLEAAYTPYLDDTNEKIYSTARVSMLTHRSFEKLRSGSDDVDDLVELFEDTMKRFPKDVNVAASIEAHLFVLIENEIEYSRNLFSKLRKRNPVGLLSPVMEQKMRNVADRFLMKDENFSRKFADRWANGKKGRQELTETVIRLLENDPVGPALVRQVVGVGEWFERNDFIAEAKSVYDAVIAAADKGSLLPEEGGNNEDVKEYAKRGLARLALQGKTIEYRGRDSAGKRLIDAEAKKDIGIVVFWSIARKESLNYLAELNRSARTLNNKPITIYAVCVDDQLPSDVNVMLRTSPMIRIVDPIDPDAPSGKNSLVEQCPPGDLPHVMMVDFGGEVHDVNAADPAKVKNEALMLLMNRSR